MFLTTHRSSPDITDHSQLRLVRICVSLVLLLSLLFLSPAMYVQSDSVIVSTLFLLWGIVGAFWHRLWKRFSPGDRFPAFMDLAFSVMVILSYHFFSPNLLPAIFLLPVLELNASHGMIGAVFVTITFACTVILSGLLRTTLIQQPWWWITTLLWICLLILVAILQMLRLSYMTTIPSLLHKRYNHFKEEQEKPSEEQAWKALEEHCSQRLPQLVAAFELPFQYMGVHTGEYRQEIEEAITTLYCIEADQQTIFLCLHRLLQAARQNWTELAAFSPREREILQLLLQNISYKEMSHRLHVSTSTIKTHVYHVFQKLEVSNREDAISFIRQRGWFILHDAHEQKFPPAQQVLPVPDHTKCGRA